MVIRDGPRYELVVGSIGKIAANLYVPHYPPQKLPWTQQQVSKVNDYLRSISSSLEADVEPHLDVVWGREGEFWLWGLRPTDRDRRAGEVISLELAVNSLVAATNDLRVVRGSLKELTDERSEEPSDRTTEIALIEDIGTVAEELYGGEYLLDSTVSVMRGHLIALGGAFPGSFYELAAPSSPPKETVEGREYWRKRNQFHMTGQGREYFAARDGETWAELFFLNWRICQRFERDEVQRDAWNELRRNARFEDYLQTRL